MKYYHGERGTERVAAIFAESDSKIRVSRLAIVEIQSALMIKVRSGSLTQSSADLQRERLLLNAGRGVLHVHEVTEQHFSMAERLIARYSSTCRLRTLDAIQLAVALDLADQQLIDHFVVADIALAEVAALESLSVLNPEL